MSGAWLAEEGYAEVAAWGPSEKHALSKSLRVSLWFCMTMNGAGTSSSWERAKPHSKTADMMFDKLPEARVHSFRPSGLGRVRLKWEIPGNEPGS